MPSNIASKSQERAQFAYSKVKSTCESFEADEMNFLVEKEKKRLERNSHVLNTLQEATFRNSKKDEAKLNAQKPKEQFKAHIKNIPMMVKANGLAAAFAFVFSKKEKDKGYKKIEEITKDWLKKSEVMNLTLEPVFHENLIQLSAIDYRRCTHEILALYTWLKRYADGMIKDN